MSTSRAGGAAAAAMLVVGLALCGCGRSSNSGASAGGGTAAPQSTAGVDAAVSPEGSGVRERNVVRKKLPRDLKSIALEYTVVLVDENGNERAVDPAEHTFEVGDSFLVRIRPQDDLYVYVFNEGPGGERTCLLPTADEPQKFVKAGTEISLPDDGGYFTFEPPAGEEALVVVALPEPSEDVRLLASAVFKGQAGEPKTDEEKESRRQADETLDKLRTRSGATVGTRGPIRKVVERLDAGLGAGGTVSHVEPPYDGEPSTYGIAITGRDGDGPELVLDIPLRSRGAAPADGGR